MSRSECGHSSCGHSISVKEQVLARSNYLCECCGEWAYKVYSPSEQPHRFAGDDMASAVAVCRRCLKYIEEDPITGRVRADAAEREAARACIRGRDADSPIFRLLYALEDYKQEQAAELIC